MQQGIGEGQKVEFAHVLRGFAALVVAFGAHIGGLFWQNRPVACRLLGIDGCAIEAVPPFVQVFHHFNWLGYGHFGVALFFLISGFVIPFSLTRLRPTQFIVARAFRILPTYWVALALGLCVLLFMAQKLPWGPFSDVLLQAGLVRDLAWIPSIDGISWTLEIEIKFYLLCALCAPLLLNGHFVSIVALIALFGGAGIAFSTVSVGQGLLTTWSVGQPYYGIMHAIGMSLLFIVYMLIGSLFNMHYRKLISSPMLAIGCGITFLWFVFVWANNRDLGAQHVDGSLNYLLALFIFSLFYVTRAQFRSFRVLDWLGDISYPLYAVHPIVGYALLFQFAKSGMNAIAAIALTLGLSLALATAIHYLVEVPTNRLGKRIARRIGQPPQRPPMARTPETPLPIAK